MGMRARLTILNRRALFTRGSVLLLLLNLILSLPACATMGLRSAVDLTVQVDPEAPGGALVYVDEHYVGTLSAVVARGLRLPEGEHRITVEKTGYFPYDQIVVSDVDPIHLKVELLELPE
jgi:hypothetical protein